MTQSKPDPEEVAVWQKRLALQANNRAWRMSESIHLSAEESDEIVHAAHAAMHLWSIVGNESNKAHAKQLLAHVYARVGQGDRALKFLEGTTEYFINGQAKDWEVALAHAVVANVAAARQEAQLHRLHYERARDLIAALPNAEDREILEATFKILPAPV